LDAYSAYHQIPLMKVDYPAIMFITPFGYFFYVKMPFRLKNAGPHISDVCSSTSRGK
jgi:hypothetical protein